MSLETLPTNDCNQVKMELESILKRLLQVVDLVQQIITGDSLTETKQNIKEKQNESLQSVSDILHLSKDFQKSNLDTPAQQVEQGVPCLGKDETINDQCLEQCGSQDLMHSEVTQHLLTRFANPATTVEIYLPTQPSLQLKPVNVLGNVNGTVLEAGLHQLSLFTTQANLLDFDSLDNSVDDIKFLWGPPGTGKTTLLVLRALQWVKHFSARHIFILQTRQDGTAASCLVEYQLQQTLNAQQQDGTDTQSAQCTFTHVDLSGLWWLEWNEARSKWDKVVLRESGKEKLYSALGLQQGGQSDTAIHIVADEAHGGVVAAVCQWLKEEGVTTVRLWAAGVESFRDRNIPTSLQRAVCPLTEPLRCPGPVVEEVMRARQIEEGAVLPYDVSWPLKGEPAVVQLRHYWGRGGHARVAWAWHCALCVKNIAAQLKSLHVGKADEGLQGLSANDVFILGCDMDCDWPEDDHRSPAPLISGLQINGYEVRTLSPTSAREEFLRVARREAESPAITVADERRVWGLERKIVVYCHSGRSYADETAKLRAFSMTTSVLIHIEYDGSE